MMLFENNYLHSIDVLYDDKNRREWIHIKLLYLILIKNAVRTLWLFLVDIE